jgi:hypothetical protein
MTETLAVPSGVGCFPRDWGRPKIAPPCPFLNHKSEWCFMFERETETVHTKDPREPGITRQVWPAKCPECQKAYPHGAAIVLVAKEAP